MRHKPFRNPQGAKVHPIREYLGSRMPAGTDGFVIEDLDWAAVAPEDAHLLVIRKFGDKYGLDGTGEFMIAEFKHRQDLGTWLDEAQLRTFGLMDEQNRYGDLWRCHVGEPTRYAGFYVVAYDQAEPGPATRWRVRRIGSDRGEVMGWDEFSSWLQIVHTSPLRGIA